MNVLKGFVTISSMISNTPGQVSPIGELSTWSMTYTRERGEYSHPTVPGLGLTTFESVTGSTPSVAPSDLVRQILLIAKSALTYSDTHVRPYDTLDFKNTLLADYFMQISDLDVGAIIEGGSAALPEWMSWKSLSNSGTQVKIWLSDASFQNEYDDYEIIVVPPLDQIDLLFGTYSGGVAALAATSISQLSDKIQYAKGSSPETYTRMVDLGYVNSINPTQVTKSIWTAIIYGKNGDNVDAIKDAILNYILTNSTRSDQSWQIILPDLFKRTEFVLLPRWDKMSIPNMTELSGLYKSILNTKECITFAQGAIQFYTDAYIADNADVFPFDYKGLAIVAVAGNNNGDFSKDLSTLFPDYIPESTSSSDFGRMQMKTQRWIVFMEQLLIAAETATGFSSVSGIYRKQTRSGVLFISGVFDTVNYLVAARSNAIYNT